MIIQSNASLFRVYLGSIDLSLDDILEAIYTLYLPFPLHPSRNAAYKSSFHSLPNS
jgi:hypothetical protein